MNPDTELVPLLAARGYQPQARLRPRHAREIESSPWSVGCETLDRDYVDFEQVGPHLGEVGAKAVRLQAGWAKCDPHADGRFQWAWLDRVVQSCVDQGVTPWLQTSYGNPACPGGGGIGLGEGIPHAPEALAAWDRWVAALAERYGDRVNTWEIWNEPDIHDSVSPAAYTAFFIRTAATLRTVQPHAHIVGLGLAGKLDFAHTFLETLHRDGRADLLSSVSIHGYPHNPDEGYEAIATLREMLATYAPHATVRQGETGAPSVTQNILALRGFEWNERKQAAWDLRRMLGHHARGVPASLFQLADMQYTRANGARIDGRNSKGLLHINADKSVSHRKRSYFAAQHLFSTLDGRFELRPLTNLAASESIPTQACAWTLRGRETPALVAWWRCDDAPVLREPPIDELPLPPVAMREPVLLDFLSGTVFALPGDAANVWRALPRTDAPLAIVERSLLTLREFEA